MGVSFQHDEQEVRPFRIYDGPSETHRREIARRALREARA